MLRGDEPWTSSTPRLRPRAGVLRSCPVHATTGAGQSGSATSASTRERWATATSCCARRRPGPGTTASSRASRGDSPDSSSSSSSSKRHCPPGHRPGPREVDQQYNGGGIAGTGVILSPTARSSSKATWSRIHLGARDRGLQRYDLRHPRRGHPPVPGRGGAAALGTPHGLTPVQVASATVHAGDQVTAVGDAQGRLRLSATRGRVGGLDRTLRARGEASVLPGTCTTIASGIFHGCEPPGWSTSAAPSSASRWASTQHAVVTSESGPVA